MKAREELLNKANEILKELDQGDAEKVADKLEDFQEQLAKLLEECELTEAAAARIGEAFDALVAALEPAGPPASDDDQ